MLIYFDKSLISLNEQINQSDVLNKLSPEYSLNLLISSIPNINDTSKKRPSLKSNSVNEYDMSIQKEIATRVQDSFTLRKQSKQLLEFAKQAVETAIEQGEDAALEWLKDKVE